MNVGPYDERVAREPEERASASLGVTLGAAGGASVRVPAGPDREGAFHEGMHPGEPPRARRPGFYPPEPKSWDELAIEAIVVEEILLAYLSSHPSVSGERLAEVLAMPPADRPHSNKASVYLFGTDAGPGYVALGGRRLLVLDRLRISQNDINLEDAACNRLRACDLA